MIQRRTLLTSTACAAATASLPMGATAQAKKDNLVLAMTLEPPGQIGRAHV